MSHTFLIQLSDTHIREPGRLAYGRLDTAPYLSNAVQAIQRLPQQPDAIVMTGDLTDFGRTEEYAHLQSLIQPLNCPIYLMPGNHDDRQQLRSSFPEHTYLGNGDFIQYSVPVSRLQLIAIDTVVPFSSHGSLCEKRLAWLKSELETHHDKPVVVAMHHPPFQTLIGHMDDVGLKRGSSELEELLMQYPNVQRVICGHLHRAIQVNFGYTLAATVPSVAHQVCLDISPQAVSAWNLEPPGFGVHVLPKEGRMVSHIAYCNMYPGPFPFHSANGQLID